MSKTFEDYFDVIESNEHYLYNNIFNIIKHNRHSHYALVSQVIKKNFTAHGSLFYKLSYRQYPALRDLHTHLKEKILPKFFQEWSITNKNILVGLLDEELENFFSKKSLSLSRFASLNF